MKTRFPIKVKEIVIDAEEYEKTVNEIETLRKSKNDNIEKAEEINIFFKRLHDLGVIIDDRSSYTFSPANKIFVTSDSIRNQVIICIS